MAMHTPAKIEGGLEHVEKSEKTQTGETAIDLAAEKQLLRKCDWHLIPPLVAIYFLSFMDRTNIGNARIQGMTADLNMQGADYNIALFVFFIPYIIFEVPSNLVIKRISPSLWLSSITVLWGISTIGMGFVNSNGGLIACRLLLGFFEAGIVPGCIYLISMYYQRYEVQWRMSLFFCAAILAGAFSGLLAYAIGNMHGVGGYSSWRWIFILEGLLTVVIGIVCRWWIPDWPETAGFLSDSERAMLISRLAADSGDAKMDHLDKRAARRVAKDWKIYLGTIAYMGIVNNGYAGSFFIPTILNQMGFKAADAQIRTIPVYVVATVLCLGSAWLADRLRHRFAFTLLGIAVATVGYILLLCQNSLSVGVRYFALFLIVGGGYITQPVVLGWLSNTMSGHYKRSISAAVQVGVGNVGGFVASNVFFDREAPRYVTGYSVSLGMIAICAIACTALYVLLSMENKKRDRGERDHRLQEPDAHNLGDDHPDWRYTT
ncbi:major facilitator superfamily domain-containing protein [Microdochium trichocladiopsis]|uniref:Major facilitator superfamily domain-containing protein n=1 Tax=Microdochium trichocladiopsis TaxID=1682393 RepID=A0A9P9BTC3_9PEZI|nr:major facilitator superfamily domain-containing protein [Microdochium trichocladiopsis]KAH7035474.1 major facilitator superfamily domain-containing protein [Microdochium trichocladiopsis]